MLRGVVNAVAGVGAEVSFGPELHPLKTKLYRFETTIQRQRAGMMEQAQVRLRCK